MQRILEIERSPRSHSVEIFPWKSLWTCREKDYGMRIMMMMMMVIIFMT
jgi:hypothetical protein